MNPDTTPAALQAQVSGSSFYAGMRVLPREEWAQRWLPVVSGGYLLKAQKRVQPLTPVRTFRRAPRLRVVGGLVEPTTRAAARIVPDAAGGFRVTVRPATTSTYRVTADGQPGPVVTVSVPTAASAPATPPRP